MSNRGSIHVNVSPALNRLKKYRNELGQQEVKRGISKAINESLKEGREKAKEVVSSTHNIPRKYLDSIAINRSNSSTLLGGIYADTKPLPLSLFKPNFNIAARRGVSFEVLKSSRGRIGYAFMIPGKKDVFGRGHYLSGPPWGFILNKAGGKIKDAAYRGLKQRKARRTKPSYKYPVTKLVTVSVNGAMNGSRNKSRIENFIERNLPKKLRTEMQRRIDKI